MPFPGRSRRNRGPRQPLAGVFAAVAALVVAGMSVLTRTYRGYPRGSFSGSPNLLSWVVIVPIVVLIAIALVRFARRNDDDPHDDADAPGDTGDGQPDDDQSKRMLVLVVAVALVALAFGFAYYASATPR